MVKYSTSRKIRKVYSNVKNDKRFKRSSQILDFTCPECTNYSLKEKKESNYVWCYCDNCGVSGESNKIMDNHLVAACDIYCTLVDSLSA